MHAGQASIFGSTVTMRSRNFNNIVPPDLAQQSTQATNDRIHRRNLEGIGEYNTYKDPGSNVPVRGTIHNNHAWKFGDGRYVSTNDPNFMPGNGVELKRIP